MEKEICAGCLEELDSVSIAGGWFVCFDCTKARHKAVLTKKCSCGKNKRREREIRHLNRVWITCDRCLGHVQSIS